jgi:hypothetical protein
MACAYAARTEPHHLGLPSYPFRIIRVRRLDPLRTGAHMLRARDVSLRSILGHGLRGRTPIPEPSRTSRKLRRQPYGLGGLFPNDSIGTSRVQQPLR